MNSLQHGFILTRKHFERHAKTFIELWLSTPKGPVKLVTDAQHLVLFVSIEELADALSVIMQADINVEHKNLNLKTFEQKDVAGLYFVLSSHFYRARDELKLANLTAYEYDIKPADRFLMERFVCAGAEFAGRAVPSAVQQAFKEYRQAKLKPCDYIPSLSVLSLDIECSMDGELYSIGLSGGEYQSVIMIGAPQPCDVDYIHWVADEQQLLKSLVSSIQSVDPDIIIGWNVVNFDFKVLVERAKLHNVKLLIGRDHTEVNFRELRADSNQSYISIAGRVVIDGIDSLKTATYQFESFTLEHVAQNLLGTGKDTHDVDNRVEAITHDFHHNKVKLAKYNLQDCVLVERIFEKTKLLDYLILRSQMTGLELDRMGGSVAAFLNLYLPKLHRAGYVSPNRPIDGGLASPGGYVMDSRPGLYRHVLVLDFKSLYPSIIRTFKIDPLGLTEGLLSPESAIPGFRGAKFSRDKHFLPDIISELWQQRDEAKKNQDSARSQAIKIIMNSFYGVLGSGGCPFYDTRLASSITLRGHEIMQTTAAWITDQGYEVIYGDTDSTFVWLENVDDAQQAREIGKSLQNLINHRWQQKLTDEFDLACALEIEFETLFDTFLMPTVRGSEMGSKKRYAGIKLEENGDTELVFKGLETVRSDWTALAKDFQMTLYQLVFDKQDVSDFILQTITSIRSGQRDDELTYRKRLRQKLSLYTKNVPPHVKAARLADSQNEQLGKLLKYQHKGWIHYVITLDGPQPIEYVTSTLDYEHYIDKQIRPIAEGILPFVGLSFETLTSQQMGLF